MPTKITAGDATPGQKYTTRGQEIVTAGELTDDAGTPYRVVVNALGVHTELPLTYDLWPVADVSKARALVGLPEEELLPQLAELTEDELDALIDEDGRTFLMDYQAQRGEPLEAEAQSEPADGPLVKDEPSEEPSAHVGVPGDSNRPAGWTTTTKSFLCEECDGTGFVGADEPESQAASAPCPKGCKPLTEPVPIKAAISMGPHLWDEEHYRFISEAFTEAGLPAPTITPDCISFGEVNGWEMSATDIDVSKINKDNLPGLVIRMQKRFDEMSEVIVALDEPDRPAPPPLQSVEQPSAPDGTGNCSVCCTLHPTGAQVGNEQVEVLRAHQADGAYCLGSGKPPIRVGSPIVPSDEFEKEQHGNGTEDPNGVGPDLWQGETKAEPRIALVKAAASEEAIQALEKAPADPPLQASVTREFARQRRGLARVLAVMTLDKSDEKKHKRLRGMLEQPQTQSRPGAVALIKGLLPPELPPEIAAAPPAVALSPWLSDSLKPDISTLAWPDQVARGSIAFGLEMIAEQEDLMMLEAAWKAVETADAASELMVAIETRWEQLTGKHWGSPGAPVEPPPGSVELSAEQMDVVQRFAEPVTTTEPDLEGVTDEQLERLVGEPTPEEGALWVRLPLALEPADRKEQLAEVIDQWLPSRGWDLEDSIVEPPLTDNERAALRALSRLLPASSAPPEPAAATDREGQLAALVEQWRSDPCWDLEDSTMEPPLTDTERERLRTIATAEGQRWMNAKASGRTSAENMAGMRQAAKALSTWLSEWPTQALAAQALGLRMEISLNNEPPN